MHNRLRAGEEPAQDLKRRLGECMERCGLSVLISTTRLLREERVRVVFVQGYLRSGRSVYAGLGVQGVLSLGGDLFDGLRLICLASDEDPRRVAFTAPLLRGRESAPLKDLEGTMRETLFERAVVLRRLAAGESAPFVFERSCWAPANAVLPGGSRSCAG
jgi:hypothetical protein